LQVCQKYVHWSRFAAEGRFDGPRGMTGDGTGRMLMSSFASRVFWCLCEKRGRRRKNGRDVGFSRTGDGKAARRRAYVVALSRAGWRAGEKWVRRRKDGGAMYAARTIADQTRNDRRYEAARNIAYVPRKGQQRYPFLPPAKKIQADGPVGRSKIKD
jgi:hypothetical protein